MGLYDEGLAVLGYAGLSGQVAFVTGTPTALPSVRAGEVILQAHPSNGGVVWVGRVTGSVVGNLNGFPLRATGEALHFMGLGNLNLLVANFDATNDRLCWIVLHDANSYPL